MRLKLDENLGRSASRLLRDAGHEVSSVAEQDLCGIGDRDLIETCRREGRCLVTLDLDFSNPLRFRPDRFSGVVVLRLPRRAGWMDLAAALETLGRHLGKRSVEGRLWVVERSRVREYQPRDVEDD